MRVNGRFAVLVVSAVVVALIVHVLRVTSQGRAHAKGAAPVVTIGGVFRN